MPEYKDTYVASVRAEILRFRPDEAEVFEEDALIKAAAYLWWNGYKDDDQELFVDIDIRTATNVAYFVYDVLKWVEQNT